MPAAMNASESKNDGHEEKARDEYFDAEVGVGMDAESGKSIGFAIILLARFSAPTIRDARCKMLSVSRLGLDDLGSVETANRFV